MIRRAVAEMRQAWVTGVSYFGGPGPGRILYGETTRHRGSGGATLCRHLGRQ